MTPSPVQGSQRQQHHCRRPQAPFNGKPPLHPPASSSPPVPACTSTPRNPYAYYESDSPKLANPPHSPLRRSVLYDDDRRGGDEDDLPTPPSFRGVIDFANSRIGRTAMSFTGDRRYHGRRSGADDLPQDRIARAPSETPTPKNASSATGASSRFALFASSMFKGVASTTSSPVALPQDDDLMNLDIGSALFPTGSDGDAFSPAAFKNLQQTATGLLNRFQAAYQQRTIAYHELKSERAAQADEQEEVETRMHHLKLQLEDMARKAAEQEATMQSLMDELKREKKLRMEERQAREKGSSLPEGSSVSEDLGVEEDQRRRRKWRRRSGGTAKSDLGFDTDEESVEEASVFSRSRSPTIATTITDVSSVEPPVPQMKAPTTVASRTTMRLPPPPAAQNQRQQQQQQQQPPPQPQQTQMNTFQKLFKGMSGEAESRGVSSCRNCEGQDASIAWDTVNLLKGENKGLKDRVGELETAVEGALDAINGVGL
ncbi:hypothetical protein ACRE_042460 [Hapsidospora chrysogenum ATCC 11550]|uniref:Uncharacterized protein n=1 Tax=Hapsidospora chrysogenum (strain ATCC 11550 / CBS 779.69 / DSM 880 / IAM 14645 / JCM 23072 / IMI 49137) TaxID=857340 RepID=A0A086T6G5_HAPC1|nr:hypothetical protein ACRE_042460 [Hapsidospora chrysogenum ATCC 11550]